MKKIVSLFVLVFLLTACGKQNQTSQIAKQLAEKDTFILFISETTCSACAEFKPVLKEVEHNYSVKHVDWVIDTDPASKEDKLVLLQQLGLADELATPTLVIVENGVNKAYRIGYLTYRDLLEFYRSYDLID